jgi:mono/diheme cytochrome c family protein
MRFLFGLSMMLAMASATAAEDSLTIVIQDHPKKFSRKDLEAKLKPVTVTIDDPVYHSKKTFDGFRLAEVFALAGLDPKSGNDEIVFTAKDGYSPNTSFDQLRKHSAVLTFQEHGGPKGHFGKVDQGKAKLDPGPYYVVWEEGNLLEKEVPWPYQLLKIEVVQFATKFAKLYPTGVSADSGAMQGFLTFKNQCIRCHSINLQGGDVGPELNTPKNVTEYWDRATLKEFISNPYAFRAKDKMPPFPQLSAKDIDHVLEYFDYMKDKKVKN